MYLCSGMENILLYDTSVASLNKGDEIIMECVRSELDYLLRDNFEITLPTHVAAFHWYQVRRGLARVHEYERCRLKFVGGTNLITKDAATWYPQWNINLWNCRPAQGCVLVGVGAGAGEKTNAYTRHLWTTILSHSFFHSARDERTTIFLRSLGLKALHTGCVTMWKLTPEFCQTIPTAKAPQAVFTLTARNNPDPRDQQLIDTMLSNYPNLYFWPQGSGDYAYLHKFKNIETIHILPATKQAYDELLTREDIDYVGTRLHAGVYAMRHARRSIILAIDERAREIHKANHLNCLEKQNIADLDAYVNSNFKTEVRMPLDVIAEWKSQFINKN